MPDSLGRNVRHTVRQSGAGFESLRGRSLVKLFFFLRELLLIISITDICCRPSCLHHPSAARGERSETGEGSVARKIRFAKEKMNLTKKIRWTKKVRLA